MKVLIVDDDWEFAAELTAQFRRHSHEVRTAQMRDEARAAMEAERADLAIVDLCLRRDGLPSGFDLIQDLRSRFPGICIVVVTGYWSVTTCETALRLGADAYLGKPATAEGILTRLEHPEGQDPSVRFPSLASAEWEHIQRALQLSGGNISGAARLLGVDRRSLLRRLQKKPRR